MGTTTQKVGQMCEFPRSFVQWQDYLIGSPERLISRFIPLIIKRKAVEQHTTPITIHPFFQFRQSSQAKKPIVAQAEPIENRVIFAINLKCIRLLLSPIA